MDNAEKSVIQEVEEQEPDNIMEQLGDAWDEVHGKSEEEAPAETEETAEVETEEETEEEPVAEAEPEEEAEEEPEEDSLEPHAHWKNEYKDAFKGMPRGGQEAWLAREKEFEQGIQAKSAELNQASRSLNDIQQAVSPFVQTWQMKGITPYAGIQRALALANELDTNPEQALVSFARERGVNLESAIQEAPYQDPQLAQVERELRELKQQQENAQQTQAQQADEALNRQLHDFKNDVDETGNPKHPHFERLFTPMANYMSTGQAQSLEQAYEMAAQYDPQIQTEKQGQSKVTKIQQKQKAADKAKVARKSVDSAQDGAKQRQQSVDEMILEQLEAGGLE